MHHRLLPIALLCCLPACNNSGGARVCTGELAVGVMVTLSEAGSGVPIDGARLALVAPDGSEEVMQQVASTPSAVYFGAIDRAGVFDLHVTASGYLPQSASGIVVRWNGCTLERQELDIALAPDPVAEVETAWIVVVIGGGGVEVVEGRFVRDRVRSTTDGVILAPGSGQR